MCQNQKSASAENTSILQELPDEFSYPTNNGSKYDFERLHRKIPLR